MKQIACLKIKMPISFEKYPFVVTDVSFGEAERGFDSGHRWFIIKTDSGRDFKFRAHSDIGTVSVFKKWDDDFSKLIGKAILSIGEVELPEDFEAVEFYPEGSEYVTDGLEFSFISYKLYEAKLSNGDTFKFLIVNYSNEEDDCEREFLRVSVTV